MGQRLFAGPSYGAAWLILLGTAMSQAHADSGGQFTVLPYSQAAPTAINASGLVTANYFDTSGNSHAILFNNGIITDLGTLGGASGGATSLNNQGQVVGWTTLAGAPGAPSYTQPYAAFLYENGHMYDLNTLLSKGTPPLGLGSASGINNLGQIIAVGQDSQVYLLTPAVPPPIPEASTLAFAAFAIAAMGVRQRFGKRKRKGEHRTSSQ
jgi:probable HAF family extracellular repeat protein